MTSLTKRKLTELPQTLSMFMQLLVAKFHVILIKLNLLHFDPELFSRRWKTGWRWRPAFRSGPSWTGGAGAIWREQCRWTADLRDVFLAACNLGLPEAELGHDLEQVIPFLRLLSFYQETLPQPWCFWVGGFKWAVPPWQRIVTLLKARLLSFLIKQWS